MSRRYPDAPQGPRPGQIYRSNCKDHTITGTREQIVAKYEGLAYQLQRENKISEAHELFQQAEHYKRVQTGELE